MFSDPFLCPCTFLALATSCSSEFRCWIMSALRCGCRLLSDKWDYKKCCSSPGKLISPPLGHRCALEGDSEDPAGGDIPEKAALFTFGSLKGACFLADINECVDPSPCRSGKCVNTLGSYKCVSCGDGYQPRNGRCIGEELGLSLGSTLAPCGSASCKPQKQQGHRQHPSPAGSQPAWPGHGALVAWVAGTTLSTLPCHVGLCCVTQTWTSALQRGLVLTDGVSTWTAPSAVPATGATRWHLTGRAAKVPGSHGSRPSEVSCTQPRGFPRLFLSAWLCLSPGDHVGWFSQHICPQSWLLRILPTHPALPRVLMQTSMSARPRLPVPLDSASTPRAPTPAWLAMPATPSPEMAASVKVSLSQTGCWRE